MPFLGASPVMARLDDRSHTPSWANRPRNRAVLEATKSLRLTGLGDQLNPSIGTAYTDHRAVKATPGGVSLDLDDARIAHLAR